MTCFSVLQDQQFLEIKQKKKIEHCGVQPLQTKNDFKFREPSFKDFLNKRT